MTGAGTGPVSNPFDQSVGLELTQLLDRDLGSDRGRSAAQAGEVRLVVSEPVKEGELPLAADGGERRGHGATRQRVGAR